MIENGYSKNDYYCIPFKIVKHLFVDEYKTKGKYPNRWTATILDHRFLMSSNAKHSIDITLFYAQPLITSQTIELEDDFFIENSKAEINIRLGQSKFRKGVLKNFGNKCALSGISESQLLTASHIIPWSHKKDFRADISNGICLYIEYDALFDKGYISFTDDFKTIIVSDTSKFSAQLKEKLEKINGIFLNKTHTKPLNKTYLDYHRSKIFKG
jgi:putative restriction endonuclease